MSIKSIERRFDLLRLVIAILIAMSIAILVILFVSVVGCSSQETHDLNDSKLIYEETISPNREYVENEEDIVDYTIEIYQDNENNILVYSTSNSEFFDPLQCEME